MGSIRLTDKVVGALPTPATGNKLRYDRDLPGFACRVTASGSKSFVLNYRIRGRERRVTIGSWPSWNVKAARTEAATLRREIDRGVDPLEEREQEEQAPTVVDLIARYERDHLPRKAPRSQPEDRALARYITDALGKAKVAAVRHADVDALHRAITRAGTPIRANRVLSLASRMFSLAVRWGWRTDNPAKGVERNPENRRTRYLTPAELARLGAALDAHPEQQSANAIRLLLLTGARRGEVLGATWDMFDLERGIWCKPSSHTKQRKEHRIPLSAPAREILVRMQAATGASRYLFPGKTLDRPQGNLKHFWATVCRQAGIEKARLHDLRHTNASILASAGLSLPIIGAMLGHSNPTTTSRYSHLLDDPLRAAAEKVGAVVTSNGRQRAEVVEMPKRRA